MPKKRFPDSLVTFQSKTIRPIQIMLSGPYVNNDSSGVDGVTEKHQGWKDQFFSKLFVFKSESSIQSEKADIRHSHLNSGGYVIRLDYQDIGELKQFLDSTQDVLPSGKIRLENSPQGLHQGLKFIVLVWPFVLSIAVVGLIGIISVLIYRELERRA